jgi:hypothetical protein
MSGATPPLPEYAFMALCSVKAQGQLYLLLAEDRLVSVVVEMKLQVQQISYFINTIFR